MPKRGAPPEVNAGSMADIAFLLLIFFLVTTTIETDAGLDRMLPPIEPPETDVVIKQKNIFEVIINKNGQLFADEELVEVSQLREKAMSFLDNGGAPSGTPDYCNYCQGARNTSSSDNPSKIFFCLMTTSVSGGSIGGNILSKPASVSIVVVTKKKISSKKAMSAIDPALNRKISLK